MMGEGTVCNVSDASPSLRDALEYELNMIESSIDAFENEVEALKALIDWHVNTAIDPRTNGGWHLVPVKPTGEMRLVMAYFHENKGVMNWYDAMGDAYKEILAAAPKYTGEK